MKKISFIFHRLFFLFSYSFSTSCDDFVVYFYNSTELNRRIKDIPKTTMNIFYFFAVSAKSPHHHPLTNENDKKINIKRVQFNIKTLFIKLNFLSHYPEGDGRSLWVDSVDSISIVKKKLKKKVEISFLHERMEERKKGLKIHSTNDNIRMECGWCDMWSTTKWDYSSSSKHPLKQCPLHFSELFCICMYLYIERNGWIVETQQELQNEWRISWTRELLCFVYL